MVLNIVCVPKLPSFSFCRLYSAEIFHPAKCFSFAPQGDHSHLLLGAITCVRAVGGLYSSDLTNSGAGSGNGSSPASRVGFGADGYGLGTAADWSLCGSADGTLSVVSSGSSAAAGGEGSGPCRLLSSRSLSDLLRHDCSDWLSAQLDPHVVAGKRGKSLLIHFSSVGACCILWSCFYALFFSL